MIVSVHDPGKLIMISQTLIRTSLLLLLICSVEIVAVSCFQFKYPDFHSDQENLNLSATGSCFTRYGHLSPNFTGSYLQLTSIKQVETSSSEQPCSVNNRVVYKYPIPFLSNDKPNISTAVSFNISFQFQLMATNVSDGNLLYGMAFFIASSPAAPKNSDDKFFGIVNDTSFGNPLLALVFDTQNSSDSYIRLDVGSITSVRSLLDESMDMVLPKDILTVWMSYDASSQNITVWYTTDTTFVALSSADPPIGTKLIPPLGPGGQVLDNNLLSNLFTTNMFVGFSATAANRVMNSSSTEIGVKILKWFFSVDSTLNIPSNITPNGTSSPTSATSTLPLKFIIPLVVLGVLFLASVACISFALFFYRKQHKQVNLPNPEHLDANSINLPRYSYRQLQDCTNNFNERTSLIGEGGFSRVYKGKLPDGSEIAIKRLKEGLRKETEFATELNIISNIRHRNLLQLLGWSYENGEALLVYKFMQKGNLETYLYGARKGTLDSATRLRILAGVAAALEYLHCGLGECVLHRDVKAANVLLTDNFEPVLGDFGLARLIKHNQVVTATRAGTPGFVAPEILITGRVTDKSDVYSFGVLMLEVACGSHAISKAEQPDQHVYLVDLVKGLQQSNNNINDIHQIIDPSILDLELATDLIPSVEDQWKKVLLLALRCCHPSPQYRPDMKYLSQCILAIIAH